MKVVLVKLNSSVHFPFHPHLHSNVTPSLSQCRHATLSLSQMSTRHSLTLTMSIRHRFTQMDPDTSEDWAEEKAEVIAEFDKFVLAPALEQLRGSK